MYIPLTYSRARDLLCEQSVIQLDIERGERSGSSKICRALCALGKYRSAHNSSEKLAARALGVSSSVFVRRAKLLMSIKSRRLSFRIIYLSAGGLSRSHELSSANVRDTRALSQMSRQKYYPPLEALSIVRLPRGVRIYDGVCRCDDRNRTIEFAPFSLAGKLFFSREYYCRVVYIRG